MINNGIIASSYRRHSQFLIIISILLICLSKLSYFFVMIDDAIYDNYMIPMLWIGLILVIQFHIPKIHPLVKITNREQILFQAMIYGICNILCQYIAGLLIYGFGRSPYDLTPNGMWLNFMTRIVPFIALEMVRAYVICSYCRENKLILMLIMVFMAVVNVNWKIIHNIKDMEGLIVFFSTEIGPELCISSLLSYFVLYGGAISSITYGGLLLIFNWFFPYHPDLNWLGKGVIGMVVPIFELFLLINKYEFKRNPIRVERMNKREAFNWLVTLVFSIGIIWFVVGVFPVYPTVIVTGSMKPLISPGDIVLANKLNNQTEIEALRAGDIILFKRDRIIITHRILKVMKDDRGNLSFQTKGDNNSVPDSRIVHIDEVRGKYIAKIPIIGYPTLWLKAKNVGQMDGVVN